MKKHFVSTFTTHFTPLALLVAVLWHQKMAQRVIFSGIGYFQMLLSVYHL